MHGPPVFLPAGLLVIDVLVQLHYMRDMTFRAVTGTMVSGLATIPLGTTGTVGLDCESFPGYDELERLMTAGGPCVPCASIPVNAVHTP